MMKKFLTLLSFLLIVAPQLFAQGAEEGWLPKIEKGPVGMVVYSLLGFVLLAAAFKFIDILTPGKLATQIAEDKNMALAIVIAGTMISVSIIIAASII